MSRVKTVIHAHTNYSYDANTSPEELIEAARWQGVDCVAITDHDTIAGALEARQIGGVRVIVGEEISTADGHLIGLFLEQCIPPGLGIEETAERIRAQGGLVLAPHPFSTLCEDSLGRAAPERLPRWLDAIEVCNAQNPFFWEDRQAWRLARRHGITAYVGADTHLRGHLAACYQVLPAFDGPVRFLDALIRAELYPGHFGPAYFAAMGACYLWGRLSPRRLPGFGINSAETCGAGRRSRRHPHRRHGAQLEAQRVCSCDSR